MIDDPRDPDEIDEVEDEVKDAGLNDDEGGNETETGQESPDEEAEEGLTEERPSRATRAVQAAKQATREAQAAKAELEKEVQALRQERQQRETADRQPKEESPEQEQQRLMLMTVEERVDYRLAKAEKRHQLEMNVQKFQTFDYADKSAYEIKAASNPRYKKYQAEVEQVLTDARRNGQSFTREQILAFVVGQKVLTGGSGTAKDAAAARVKSQQARANSGRSDSAAPRRNEGGNTLRDLERRLEGRNI